jgi:hypothetical protein
MNLGFFKIQSDNPSGQAGAFTVMVTQASQWCLQSATAKQKEEKGTVICQALMWCQLCAVHVP